MCTQTDAVPTRSTAAAADAATMIRDMLLYSGAGFPDVLAMDHDSKSTATPTNCDPI